MKKWQFAAGFIACFSIVLVLCNVTFPAENGTLILPEYFAKMNAGAKKGGLAEEKISGLLRVQIQAKNSYAKQPTIERLNAMRKMGIKTEEVNKHMVYIHSKTKLHATQISSLKEIGVTVYEDTWVPPLKNHPAGYVIASMPVDRLYDLAGRPFVVRLETAEKVLLPKNDEASKSIKADKVWESEYDGAGVRIAVLDSSLDVTHKDIPAPVIGKDFSNFPSIDDTIESTVSEHGTHVTGSVLGRGTQSEGKYKGMAHGADLIFLKVGDDSTAGASTAAISAAIRAAVDVYDADIVTMSYGGFETYNDGSDENCQAVDYAFDKGILVFMAAGNEADAAIHYSGTVTANNTTDFIKVNVDATSQASLYFLLNWFDGKGTSNNLSLTLYDTNKIDMSPYILKYPEVESSRGTEAEWAYFNYYVSGPATFYLKVKNNSGSDQFFHIYSFDYSTTFESADPNYTIGSPAAADNAIAVASYTTRNSWTDYKGISWAASGTIGEISSFSSRGPRIDGTKKPEIATPGERIISARDRIVTWPGNEDDYIIDNDGTNDGNGPADYLLLRGTSMACPIAAGASALLMQANPSIKGHPSSVRNALFQTASNNGEQDTTYGYGKMDILAALNFIVTVTPMPSSSPTETPAPTVTLSPFPTPAERGSVYGIVNDSDDDPLQGVKVTISDAVDIQEAGFSYSTETDENGYYLFTDLAAGYYTLTYEKEGYETKTESVVLAEGEDKGLAPVIMEYTEEGTITGYVENAKGNPIESAKIKLKGITTKVLFTTYTDADGFFEFSYLDADTYIVIAKKKGYKRSSKTVRLGEGEEKEIQIKMRRQR